jgi:hypothetical protein
MVCNSTLLILDKLEENIPLNPPRKKFQEYSQRFHSKASTTTEGILEEKVHSKMDQARES